MSSTSPSDRFENEQLKLTVDEPASIPTPADDQEEDDKPNSKVSRPLKSVPSLFQVSWPPIRHQKHVFGQRAPNGNNSSVERAGIDVQKYVMDAVRCTNATQGSWTLVMNDHEIDDRPRQVKSRTDLAWPTIYTG